jgi:hypothetical protein
MKFVKNLVPLATLILFLFSCRKESFTSSADAKLQTSVDTLHFDTVFTTAGSVSQYLKIINNNNKGIRLSSVRLAGGAASPFKINVDGVPGPQVGDVEVLASDSVYVRVTISINPNALNLAFIVRDSIEINYNGNRQFVQLDAFGQNAHFFRNRKITGSEAWNNDLPYVILGRLTVDTTATLTINKGCKIYMHADAPFIINGSLQVNGERYDSTKVLFTGDRLDEPYKNYPASYPGLIFTGSSKNNTINYAIIKNSYQGIAVIDPSASGTKLTLNETIIDNAYTNGLIGINTSVNARNVLISNCGQNLALGGGGTYDFKHCTVASYSNSFVQHKEPVFILTNYTVQGNTIVTAGLNASFTNCIFFGEQNGFVNNEVAIDIKGSQPPNINFNKVLWRMQAPPSATGITVTTPVNQLPLFDSINTANRFFNFRLKDNSPAKNTGINSGVTIDLDGNPRPVGLPDLGSYEKQ